MNDAAARPRNPLRALRAAAAPAAKRALYSAGCYGALRRVLPSRLFGILRYHAICGQEGYSYADPAICVTPENFERHIAYLTTGYRVLRLDEAVGVLSAGKTLPANAVAITFDDGYADNLAAARVLAKYGASATFYITAGCLAGGQPFWPSELRHLVRSIAAERVSLHADGVHVELDLSSPSRRGAVVSQLTKTFKAHPISVREALRAQLRRLAGDRPAPRVMLTWDELREMQALGMTVGSHTMTHPNLPNAGVDAATQELTESRRRLEAELGVPVTMFSYPNGGADRYMTGEVQKVVRGAGYLAATTSRNAFAGPHSDLFALERIQVKEAIQDLAFALEIERFAFKPRPRRFESA